MLCFLRRRDLRAPREGFCVCGQFIASEGFGAGWLKAERREICVRANASRSKGFVIDIIKMQFRVPPKKIVKLKSNLDSMISSGRATFRGLARVAASSIHCIGQSVQLLGCSRGRRMQLFKSVRSGIVHFLFLRLYRKICVSGLLHCSAFARVLQNGPCVACVCYVCRAAWFVSVPALMRGLSVPLVVYRELALERVSRIRHCSSWFHIWLILCWSLALQTQLISTAMGGRNGRPGHSVSWVYLFSLQFLCKWPCAPCST